MLRLVLLVSFVSIGVVGCDTLFPELTGANADMTTVPDGGDGGTSSTVLTGKVCLLNDLRSPASCLSGANGRHITIEETRASADAALDGTFSISLVGVTDTATIAVVDGPATLGQSIPTVMRLSGATLANARSSGAALPVVRTAMFETLALQAGAPSSANRGALLGWILDGTGKAVPGVSATRIIGATGPLYDAGGSTVLEDGRFTGVYGTVAFLELPPGTAQLIVTAPAGSTLAGDTFNLPIRGGAVTVSALSLPSR